MKRIGLSIIIFFFALMPLFADAPPPPDQPGNGNTGSGGNPLGGGTPIDDGTLILLTMGIAYGSKMILKGLSMQKPEKVTNLKNEHYVKLK